MGSALKLGIEDEQEARLEGCCWDVAFDTLRREWNGDPVLADLS